MDIEVFPRAPIEEAILAFDVPFLDDLTTSARHFHKAIENAFPDTEQSPSRAAARFTAAAGRSLPARHAEPNGLQFTSADGLQVVTLTRYGLSYHRLRPYMSWEHFEAGVRPVWQAFANYFGPERVVELRLRYLNRVVIPLGNFELTDYFRTFPSIPIEIDTGIGDFLMRLHMVDNDIPATANLTMRSDPGNSPPATYPVVFDVEVATSGGTLIEDKYLWADVHSLRDYKNRIFFQSITEKTRGLFR